MPGVGHVGSDAAAQRIHLHRLLVVALNSGSGLSGRSCGCTHTGGGQHVRLHHAALDVQLADVHAQLGSQLGSHGAGLGTGHKVLHVLGHHGPVGAGAGDLGEVIALFLRQLLGVGSRQHVGTGGTVRMGGNDEREQTLNQLLTEMDGFDGKKGVVILAATNRPESLDPALLRPGRFDRRIPVELPDLKGREAILKVHGKKVKVDESVDYNEIARATNGASGAELANIVNEAALRAVRMGRKTVSQQDLEESVETVIAGYQKKDAGVSGDEKKIVSYHEIGHALVAALQTHSAPVHKITIVPRTSGALGYTMQVEADQRFLMSREEAFNKIVTLTGGRAAEELIFHSITTGASNDIEQATKIARAMVTRYGMSDHFGMVALETVNNAYLGGDTSLACSAETAARVDEEVIALVKSAYEKAKAILSGHEDKLHELADYLLDKETITGEEFMKILEEKKEDGEAEA